MTKDQRAREQLGRLIAVERRKAGLSIADVAKRLDRRPAWVARNRNRARGASILPSISRSRTRSAAMGMRCCGSASGISARFGGAFLWGALNSYLEDHR